MKWGTRREARAMWSRVAGTAEYDEKTLDWIRAVARRMLEADRRPLKQRAGAVLAASGLSGRDTSEQDSDLFTLHVYVDGVKEGRITERAIDYMARTCNKEGSDEALTAWIKRLLDGMTPEQRADWEPYLQGRREV